MRGNARRRFRTKTAMCVVAAIADTADIAVTKLRRRGAGDIGWR
jgi:hypothetical protein